MKIKYEIEELIPRVFCVKIEDKWDLGMTFLRPQEYYENPYFKGKNFSMFEFIKHQSANYAFDYPAIWDAYNFPYQVAKECYRKLPIEEYTEYDEVMVDILTDIHNMSEDRDFYVIGISSDQDINHEICHALYYIDEDYKYIADKCTHSISTEAYDVIKANLLNIGYDDSVVDDEIQAYFLTGLIPEVVLDVPKNIVKEVTKKFDKKVKDKLNALLISKAIE